MRALALALLLALPVSAQEKVVGTDRDIPFVDDERPQALKIEDGKVTLSDGAVVYLGPGLYFNRLAAIQIGGEIEGLRAENESLKASAVQLQAESGVPIHIVLGIVVSSFLAGAALTKLIKQ